MKDLYCNVGYGALAPTAVIDITADAIWSAQSHLVKEWGDYGYRIVGFTRLVPWMVPSIWLVHYICTVDGARFGALVDRYGNIRDIPQVGATQDDVIALAKEMLAEQAPGWDISDVTASRRDAWWAVQDMI
jgi:hypothetical protein